MYENDRVLMMVEKVLSANDNDVKQMIENEDFSNDKEYINLIKVFEGDFLSSGWFQGCGSSMLFEKVNVYFKGGVMCDWFKMVGIEMGTGRVGDLRQSRCVDIFFSIVVK